MKLTVTIEIEGGSTWTGEVESEDPQRCIELYNTVANYFMILGRAMVGGHRDVTIDPFKESLPLPQTTGVGSVGAGSGEAEGASRAVD